MGTFEIDPAREEQDTGTLGLKVSGLGRAVLVQNARRFTDVRWIVVAAFVAAGLLSWLGGGFVRSLGLVPPQRWPWALAAILGFTNVLHIALVRRLTDETPQRLVESILWVQIVVDLLFVTVLVHLVGSINTFCPFVYLFHIVLACIFFSKRSSLLVTLLASGLYVACVALEMGGIVASEGLVAPDLAASRTNGGLVAAFAASAIFVWFVVWYFAATLAESVQRRDRRLMETNEQLRQADRAKDMEVSRVTHDLKEPFVAIEQNVQRLRQEHWDAIPDGGRRLLERIERRAQTLSKRIKDMLALGSLKLKEGDPEPLETVDLAAVMEAAIEECADHAQGRRVSLDVDVPPIRVMGRAAEYQMLLANVVSNAISYSQEGGTVTIAAEDAADHATVAVTDRGIGIKPEALEHIFDEYYRTAEAARFNRRSTGLGLAIVKRVATDLGLRVRVTSEVDKGTKFEIIIPRLARP